MPYTIDIVLEGTDNVSDDARAAEGALDNLKTKGTDAKTGMEDAAKGTSKLKDEISGAIAAISLFTVADKIGQFMELGQEVSKTKVAFDELTDPIGEMEEVLGDLREATGGAVDDLTLMANANAMLKTGLASNAEELTAFTDMAFSLTGSSEGVENFIAAINNMSYERLDTLGISASAVRDRVRELAEAGMDTQAAFKQAVLEEGAKTLDRLGAAATSAETPLARLGVGLQNAVQNVAASASDALQSIVGIAEIALGLNPVQQAMVTQAQELGTAYADVFTEYANMGMDANQQSYLGGKSMQQQRDIYVAALTTLFEAAIEDPSILQSRDRLTNELFKIDVGPTASGPLVDAFVAVWNLKGAEEANQEANRLLEERQRIIDNAAKAAQASMGSIPSLTELVAAGEGVQDVYAAQDALEGFTTAFGDLAALDVPDLLRPEQAAAIADEYERAQDELENLQSLNAQGLISDAQLQSAEDMTENLEKVKDAAYEAAEAFENLSLADVFGQTDGGMAGEVAALIDEYLSAKVDAGTLSQEALDQINQGLALGTGQETVASVNMEEVIAPLIGDIATQLGVDAANVAVDRVTQFLQEAALAGLTQEQIAAAMDDVIGFTRDEKGNVTETEGFNFEEAMAAALGDVDWAQVAEDTTTISDNINSLATTDGTALTETLSLAQGSVAEMVTLTPNLVSDFQAVSPALAEANGQLMEMVSTIQELTGRMHVVKMRVEVDATQLEAVVKQNGGRMPGVR